MISAAGIGTYFTPGAHSTKAVPKFTDANAGDFSEKPSSPTVDAGHAGAAYGITDLAGEPRVLNAHVDIGAYEFDERLLAKATVKRVNKHTIVVTVTVHPDGSATTTQLSTQTPVSCQHGCSYLYSKKVVTGAKVVHAKVHLTLTGLQRHHKYPLRIQSGNPNGYAYKNLKDATTR